MSISVGSVTVDVVPDAARFNSELAAQITPQANRLGQQIGEQIARQISQGIRDGLGTNQQGPAREQGVRSGGAFADAFKQRIQAAMRDLPPVRIGAATTEAEQKLRDLRVELEELSGKTIGVDLDAGAAQAKIDELKVKIRELSASGVDVQVRTDLAAALAQLEAFQAEVRRLNGEDATVDVNVNDHGSLARAGSGISGLMAGALALGPALIPIGAAAVAGIGAIGPLAIAGAVGLGVLALGVSGVSSTVQLLGQQHAAAAQQAAKFASSQAASAGAIASAEASLANTRANTADAAVRAAETVGKAKASEVTAEKDAAEKVAAAEQQATTQVQSALGRQEQAERSLSDAQRSQRQAQEDLTQARKDAQAQIEDLTNSLADNALAQRQSTLDVADAQTNLNKVLADPAATDAQRAQAQLTYDSQIQRQKELATQGERLSAQQAEATQKGVEGSALVTAAQQRVTDSNQQVIDSTTAVGDASAAVDKARVDGAAAVAKAQTDGAAKVAAAQTAVTDAITAQATQQRQAAFSIAQAQQALASAMQSTGTAGSAALAGINAQLAKVNPATLAFAEFVRGTLSPAIDQIKASAAAGLLPGMQAGIEALLPLLPGLTDFVGDLAKTMGDLFAQAGKALTDPFWTGFFTQIGSVAGPLLTDFVTTLGNIATGFAGIIQAFIPMSGQVGGGIVDMSKKFADWGKNLKDSPGFKSFVAYVKDNWPKVKELIENVVAVIKKVVKALAPVGSAVLTVLGPLTRAISRIPIGVLSELAVVIGVVVGALKLVEIGLGIINPLLAIFGVETELALGPIGLIVIAIAGLVIGVIYAYTHFQTFRDIVDGVFKWFKDAAQAVASWFAGPFVDFFTGAWDAITGAFQAAWDWVRDVFGKFWNGLKTIFTDPMQAAYNIIDNLLGTDTGVRHLFNAVWDWVSGTFGRFWNGLKTIFTDPVEAAHNVINNLFGEGGAVRKVFSSAVDAIGTIWDGLKELMKAPIRFVVNTVLNDGLINAFDWITSALHIPLHVDPIKLPKGFAGGGYTGDGGKYEPAGVVHGGEFVVDKERTSRFRPLLDAIHGGMLDHLPGYSGGGLVGAVTGALGSAWDWAKDLGPAVLGWISDPVGHITDLVTSALGDTGAGPIGDLLVSGAGSVASAVGGELLSAIGLGGDSGGSAGGGSTAVPASRTGNQAAVQAVAAQYGWGSGPQWDALVRVINRESGFNNTAQNPTSTAYGMFQFLDSTWSGYGTRKTSDPSAQANAGLRYIEARYGTPAAAFAHEQTAGWYDQGGELPVGHSLVYNGTGQPELIAPRRTFEQVIAGIGGGGHTDARSYPLTVMAQSSPEEIAAAIREGQRLQEFLHG